MANTDTDAKRPNFHFRAWQEGYRAGQRGRTGADSPYDGDCREARAWLMGLLEGRTKQLMIVSAGTAPLARKAAN